MGWTPQQVDAMSFWTFRQACEGWLKANGGEQKTESLGDDEHDRLMRKHGRVYEDEAGDS